MFCTNLGDNMLFKLLKKPGVYSYTDDEHTRINVRLICTEYSPVKIFVFLDSKLNDFHLYKAL